MNQGDIIYQLLTSLGGTSLVGTILFFLFKKLLGNYEERLEEVEDNHKNCAEIKIRMNVLEREHQEVIRYLIPKIDDSLNKLARMEGVLQGLCKTIEILERRSHDVG